MVACIQVRRKKCKDFFCYLRKKLLFYFFHFVAYVQLFDLCSNKLCLFSFYAQENTIIIVSLVITVREISLYYSNASTIHEIIGKRHCNFQRVIRGITGSGGRVG